MNKFKENIKSLREERKLTQKELADALGFSRMAVSHWEKGVEPYYNTLIKIANFFDVSIDELLGNDKLCKK